MAGALVHNAAIHVAYAFIQRGHANSASFSVGAIAVTLAGYPSKSNAVDMIVSYMSDVASVRYEMGYAAAIAVVLFLMMIITRAVVGKILQITQK